MPELSVYLQDEFRRSLIDEAVKLAGSQSKLAALLSEKFERRIIRERVKDWKSGRHFSGWRLFMPIPIFKEICRITGKDYKSALKFIVAYNPPEETPELKQFKVKYRKLHIVKRNNKYYLDLYSVLPEKTLPAKRSHRELPIFCKVSKDYLDAWTFSSWLNSKIKLKRYILLDDLFFTGAAIYASEGTTHTKNYNNDSVSLGNSEATVINIFTAWLKSFLLGFSLACHIDYNGKSCDREKLIRFWQGNLNFDINQNIKINLRKNLGSGLLVNNGVFQIRIRNTLLRTFTIKLLKINKELALQNKEWAKAYLQGLLASEGSVPKEKLKMIGIGATDQKERAFIQKLLRKLKLTYSEGINQINIHGWNSYIRLFLYDAFRIAQVNSINKKARFLKGLRIHQKTERLLRLYPFIGQKFTAQDWQRRYNLALYISAHKYLNSLVKDGFAESSIENRIKYYWAKPEKVWLVKQIYESIRI